MLKAENGIVDNIKLGGRAIQFLCQNKFLFLLQSFQVHGHMLCNLFL